MVTMTLQSGKKVTTTDHHMMSVFQDTTCSLKKAAEIVVGDTFCSITDDVLDEDAVTSVDIHFEHTAVANVIVQAGHVLADDIVVSVRTDGDMPESLWKAGTKINQVLGTYAAHKFCQFGNWFRKTRVASYLD